MELSGFTAWIQTPPSLYKSDIKAGDRVLVKTRNSVYEIQVLKGGEYEVRGGRFDQKKISPVRTTIAGCGMGSVFVKADLVAACGLRIEFGNRIITSTISAFIVFKDYQLN